MTGLAICYSPPDHEFAQEIAAYLSAHTFLQPTLASSRGYEDFLDTIEQCLTVEIMVVVLSPAAVPSLWPRAMWERVLVEGARASQVHIAYVLRENCPVPQILRRRHFFDFTITHELGLKALRRWTIEYLWPNRKVPVIDIVLDVNLTGQPELPRLVNEPGVAEVTRAQAAWLLRHCWRDFEHVCWVQCANVGHAGIQGELGRALQLNLPETLEQNRIALRRWVAQYRSLLVFDQLPKELAAVAALGGKSSLLIVPPDGTAVPASLETLRATFLPRNPDEALCLQTWNSYMNSRTPEPNHWPEVLSFGFRALSAFRNQSRYAEAHELLEWMVTGQKTTTMPEPSTGCVGRSTGSSIAGTCLRGSALPFPRFREHNSASPFTAVIFC